MTDQTEDAAATVAHDDPSAATPASTPNRNRDVEVFAARFARARDARARDAKAGEMLL